MQEKLVAGLIANLDKIQLVVTYTFMGTILLFVANLALCITSKKVMSRGATVATGAIFGVMAMALAFSRFMLPKILAGGAFRARS